MSPTSLSPFERDILIYRRFHVRTLGNSSLRAVTGKVHPSHKFEYSAVFRINFNYNWFKKACKLATEGATEILTCLYTVVLRH